MTDKASRDIGLEIANSFTEWRPEKGAGDEIASAIMTALERYSIKLEGSGESNLSSCLYELRRRIDERLRSI